MFEKYTDPSKVDPKHIEEAYNMLKDYCEKNNQNLLEFVKNKDNIAPAAATIHKELPMAIRLVLKKDKIADLITNNLPFIQAKAEEFYKAENGKKKATKSKKS